jgi:hypothetical protein
MEKIDFAKMKLVPIASVLSHYGVESKRSGDYLIAKKCPLPTHESKETETFKANVVENWWRCFSRSCRKGAKDGGDVVDLVCIMEGLQPLPAAQKLTELFCLNQNAPPKAERDGRGLISSPDKNKPLGFTLQVDPRHPMIRERGINVCTAELYGVGYYRSKQGTASMDNRIIFPLKEDGVLVGYIGRTVLPVTPDNPKWKLGKGLAKTMLFGLEQCYPFGTIIVCESPWEVLLGHQMERNAVSILGTTMTKEQEEKLQPYYQVWLLMDNDEAGRKASAELSVRLERKHRIIRSFLKD